MKMVILMAAGAIAFDAHAAGKNAELPPSGILYSSQYLSRLQFQCYFSDQQGNTVFSPTGNIKCEFNQVMLLPPKKEPALDKVASEFEKSWQEALRKDQVRVGEMQKTCSDPKEAKFSASERRRLSQNEYSAFLLPAQDEHAAYAQRLCACQDMKCLHDVIRDSAVNAAKEEAETCSVFSKRYEVTLQRSGDNWVGVESMGGVCYSSTTTTLSPDKDAQGFHFWNMRTVNVPSPDAAKLELCLNRVEDSIDVWRMYPVINLPCRKLKL